jgi:TRAP-type mannitol/chloroaromatic compound transport system substrate-binding protein
LNWSISAGAVCAQVKWRLASSFPKSLDTIYGGAEVMAKMVSELTDGKFQIQVFAAGEIVPGAAGRRRRHQRHRRDVPHRSYYYVGKDPTFAIAARCRSASTPASRTPGSYQGGGNELFNEFYKKFNIYGCPAATPAARWAAGSARRSRPSPICRASRCASAASPAQVLQKLGVVPQQIAGGDIYPALEKGTIDGAEWVGPYDDEKLGFNKVAPYYYYPGFWEGGPTVHAAL